VKWIWVLLVVFSSTAGDVFSAKGMSERGEVEDFRPSGIARVFHYIGTHPMVLAGIVTNAFSFIAFLALLSVATLSFSVPATALSYILKTLLAEFYLHEKVDKRRWMGVALVSAGIALISI
jgi:drug/metabolite transporter (DMT)-like permease